MRRVYSYTNNATASEAQAIKMLEDDLGYPLKVIPKSQVEHYTSKYGVSVWVLCMSDTCKRMVYVTPKNRKPHYSDYQKLLASAKKRGVKILPKIKYDFEGFPSYRHTVVQENYFIEFEVKLSSDIILKSTHSKMPITYTPGQLMNIEYSQEYAINNYLQSWNKMELIGFTKDHINLKLGSSLTNQYYNLDVAVNGNTFSTTITPKTAEAVVNNDWVIEGEISLEISGAVYPYNSQMHHSSVGQIVLHHEPSKRYTSYILLGIGVTALGLATFGVGDIVLLSAAGATAIAASN